MTGIIGFFVVIGLSMIYNPFPPTSVQEYVNGLPEVRRLVIKDCALKRVKWKKQDCENALRAEEIVKGKRGRKEK